MSGNPKTKLPGKVAVITGGASGIGEATARLFAEEGARMVIIADIQESLGQEVVRSIGPHRCRFVYVDVTDEEQVRSMVELVVRDYGRIDIMFSNAGILSRSEQKVIDLDLGEFDRLIAVNVRGMAACVKHAARAMVEDSVRGSIVCTGSVSGSSAGSRRTDYHMAKHAVVGLVKSASVQLGVHGIRVNCVSPYAIATPLLCDAWDADPGEVEKMYEPHTALKGRVLRVEDVAGAVLFLASEDSQFISGHDLVVDGGYLHYKGEWKTR